MKRITQKEQVRADNQAAFDVYSKDYAERQKQTIMLALRDWPTEHLHAALNQAYSSMYRADSDLARSLQPRIDALELTLQHRKNK